MSKELKMGWDDAPDTFTFGLIATAEAIMIIQKEYDAPIIFDNFYQINAVINEAIKRASKKLNMTLSEERRTQIIVLLHHSLERAWVDIRKVEDQKNGSMD